MGGDRGAQMNCAPAEFRGRVCIECAADQAAPSAGSSLLSRSPKTWRKRQLEAAPSAAPDGVEVAITAALSRREAVDGSSIQAGLQRRLAGGSAAAVVPAPPRRWKATA